MKKYTKNPAIKSKTMDNEQILLNLENGDYFGLNEIASDMWELIDGCNDLHEIVHKLSEKYDVEKSVLEADVIDFIKVLIEKKIISEG